MQALQYLCGEQVCATCFYWQMGRWMMWLFSRDCNKNFQLNDDEHKLFYIFLEVSFSFLPQSWRTTKILTRQWELDGKSCLIHLSFSLYRTVYRVGDFKGLHQISRGETQISWDINKHWMRSIKSQIKQMELSTSVQTGRNSQLQGLEMKRIPKGWCRTGAWGWEVYD